MFFSVLLSITHRIQLMVVDSNPLALRNAMIPSVPQKITGPSPNKLMFTRVDAKHVHVH